LTVDEEKVGQSQSLVPPGYHCHTGPQGGLAEGKDKARRIAAGLPVSSGEGGSSGHKGKPEGVGARILGAHLKQPQSTRK